MLERWVLSAIMRKKRDWALWLQRHGEQNRYAIRNCPQWDLICSWWSAQLVRVSSFLSDARASNRWKAPLKWHITRHTVRWWKLDFASFTGMKEPSAQPQDPGLTNFNRHFKMFKKCHKTWHCPKNFVHCHLNLERTCSGLQLGHALVEMLFGQWIQTQGQARYCSFWGKGEQLQSLLLTNSKSVNQCGLSSIWNLCVKLQANMDAYDTSCGYIIPTCM